MYKIYEKWNLVDWPQNSKEGYDCEIKKVSFDKKMILFLFEQ